MRRRVVFAFLAALTLTGCGQATPVSVTEGSPQAVKLEPSPVPKVAKIGSTYEYSDGLKVTVSAAKRFKIGQYAAGGKPGGTGVMVTVVLLNGTTETFDATLTSLAVSYGEAGEQAEQVFDADQGLGNGFTGLVAPGRKATARFGFAVPAAGMKDVQVEVRPGFLNHEPTLFSGSA
jgi:hypothetical protein